MLIDLITIFVSVILIAACIYGIKTKYRIMAIIILILLIPPILITLVINIPIIFSPLTPKVRGKVIDAETKKPLAGFNVNAGWYAKSASVGGASGEYYKIFKTKTNTNGEFILPRSFKALTVNVLPGFPLYERKFEAVNVIVYPPGYDYKIRKISNNNGSILNIALERVQTDKAFLDNITTYWNSISLMHKGSGDEIADSYERGWLKYAYYQFEKQYPNSKADTDSVLKELANILESLNEPDSIYLLQKILDKYPNGNLAWYAKNNIDSLKRTYGIKY